MGARVVLKAQDPSEWIRATITNRVTGETRQEVCPPIGWRDIALAHQDEMKIEVFRNDYPAGLSKEEKDRLHRRNE